MAELTALESKIGEVLGLAMAAQGATEKVGKLVEDEGNHGDLRQALERMHKEAKEAEERTTDVAENLEGKKTAILEKARETKQEATEMMSTYLGDDADALDGFEFLTMAEAGEVGHWSVVRTMNERANLPGLAGARRLDDPDPAAALRDDARGLGRAGRGRRSERAGVAERKARSPGSPYGGPGLSSWGVGVSRLPAGRRPPRRSSPRRRRSCCSTGSGRRTGCRHYP